jgi:dienelactone hydrolase
MRSDDVSWELDDIPMYGTIMRPEGAGPFPAVVLVAGSGPTDRDWCSPMLPGGNGSGRLFAEVLATDGIASIRYDKRASGPYLREILPRIAGRMSMRTHLDELEAAVRVLADQDDIDETRLVGLGNSEGAIHVLHHALAAEEHRFVGLVLAAPPGRPLHDVLLAQLELQASAVPGGSEMLDAVRAAADRYGRGEPMDVDPALPEGVRQVLLSFETPANLPFARELWTESTTDALRAVRVPVLVLIGRRDVQVDADADGGALRAAVDDRGDVTFAFPEHANHVFKEDHRTPAEVAATPGNGYNDAGTRLDPETVAILLEWLATVFGRTPPG